jgi:surface protein
MYPTIISLENLDFEKLDILPGTAKFAVADFAILNAGSIYDLSITVDRYGQNLTKSCSGLVFSESNIETKFAEDVSGTSSITGILDNGLTLSNEMMHQNIIQPISNFDSVLKGILFAKMVHSVFDMDNGTIKSYDFTDPSKRNESIFFDNDQTLNVANNIKYQTVGLDSSGNGNSVDDSGNIVYFDSAFNQTITNWYGVSGESILNSEVEYWNARTGLDLSGNHTETGVIPFNPDDKLMVMYSISTTFKQPNNDFHGKFSVNVANLPAFVTTSTNSVVDDTMVLRPGIGDSSFESRFILEYNVNPYLLDPYLTGHKFIDPSGGYEAWDDRPTGSLRGAVDQWIYGSWDESVGGHISTWDTSEVTDFSNLFFRFGAEGNPGFNEDLSHWDVSSGTSMAYMFGSCPDYNQPMGDWDVSSVTDMQYMFQGYGGSNFNQDISEWDVSSVTDMQQMFNKANAFNQPLNKWRVDNVTDMGAMFYGDSDQNANLGGGIHPFNQPLFQWNVSKVTNMFVMFMDSLFNQDISGWDTTAAATNITWDGYPHTKDMFLNCPISEENKPRTNPQATD